MPTDSKTSHRICTAREDELQAFELRKAGATYLQIGKQLGISKQKAYDGVKRVLLETIKITTEEAVAVRALEIDRLDAMFLGLWPRARSGNEQAVAVALKIMERRSRLLGLDAPEKSEITGNDGAKLIESISVHLVRAGEGDKKNVKDL
jgi:hypothetical protein